MATAENHLTTTAESNNIRHCDSRLNHSGYAGLVHTKDNINRISYIIKGVHCAACIQKIESALIKIENVKSARLNFSTGQLNVEWTGHINQANDFANIIESFGYKVNPYNPDIEKNNQNSESRFLLICLAISGFASGNLMMFSIGLWSTDIQTMGFATREFMHWISAIIAIPTVIYSGRPFFYSAWNVLKNGHTNMDVPISLALILATIMSLFETIRGGEYVYFDSATMLIFFLLIGRYLDFNARRQARSAATDLMQTLSGFANIIENNTIRSILIRDLREDMLVSVAVGEKIPVDSIIIEGESSIDTSLITGETLPRPTKIGDNVYGGTINIDSPLIVKVLKSANDSLLADVIRLMEKAEQAQAKYVRIADKVAKLYTPIVHILAASAFIIWWLGFGIAWQEALMVSTTLLIITCPCALALAVPVVQVLATSSLMKKNILIKSGDALERLNSIDTVFFDKTGTLTLGKPVLIGAYDVDILQLAASIAAKSNHPLSKALKNAYKGSLLAIENVKEFAGRGLEATYNNKIIQLGSRSWCGDSNSRSHSNLEIWLKIDNENPILFRFNDELRQDTKDVIKAFQAKNIQTILLSGDRNEIVQQVAKECGIPIAYGELTPIQKYDYLQSYKNKGHKVLMVGDGLNDAPVLTGADISIAPGTALDIAQNAADIIFMGDNLSPIFESYKIAQKSQVLVKENFILTTIYNIIAVPLALFGYVTPLVAAIAMSSSSLVVIANSFRLKLNKSNT